MNPAIGQPIERVDGTAKVTGAARYTADAAPSHVAYAVVVGARVASGRVRAIDASEAERAAGVLAVFTHHNLPKVAAVPKLFPSLFGHAAPGETFFPMQDDEVHYAGQPVALVVADTLERAQHAATLLAHRIRRGALDDDDRAGHATRRTCRRRIFGGLIPGRSGRGDVEAGLVEAAVRIDATYRFAANHHNPIETSAATAVWDDGRLILHDTTQGITATQVTVAALLGLPPTARPGHHAVRRRRLRRQGDDLASPDARGARRPRGRPAGQARPSPASRCSAPAASARSRSSGWCWALRPTGGSPQFVITSSRSRRRSTTGRSPPSAAPRKRTPARTTRASTGSSAATR